jgi:magnesium chelatase subunit I
VVRRRDAFERDATTFFERWKSAQSQLQRKLLKARERFAKVDVPVAALERAAQLCIELKTDGLRGELTLIRAARALACFDADPVVGDTHLKRVASPALRHRLRRNPLDDTDATQRVERAVEDIFGA